MTNATIEKLSSKNGTFHIAKDGIKRNYPIKCLIPGDYPGMCPETWVKSFSDFMRCSFKHKSKENYLQILTAINNIYRFFVGKRDGLDEFYNLYNSADGKILFIDHWVNLEIKKSPYFGLKNYPMHQYEYLIPWENVGNLNHDSPLWNMSFHTPGDALRSVFEPFLKGHILKKYNKENPFSAILRYKWNQQIFDIAKSCFENEELSTKILFLPEKPERTSIGYFPTKESATHWREYFNRYYKTPGERIRAALHYFCDMTEGDAFSLGFKERTYKLIKSQMGLTRK